MADGYAEAAYGLGAAWWAELINPAIEAALMLRTGTGGFIPFAAPSTAAFAENSPKGRFMDEARCQRDRSPFWQPSAKARSTGCKRQPGGLFFGYFLLAAQKKVTRLRVR
jgi:hypothetical protein